MSRETTVAETEEMMPRYYGLSFQRDGVRIFDNPSVAAIAYFMVTSPDRKGGLRDMLERWQKRKPAELEGKFGYAPLFQIPLRARKKLLESSPEGLVETLRERIKANHGSYNLFDCSGKEAVDSLVLRGELLTAEVKSQKEGSHSVNLKGAVLGSQGGNRYADSHCGCPDSRWMETKGGKNIIIRRNCLHIKAAETESRLQEDVRTLHPAKKPMRVKDPHDAHRSLTWNFVSDPFLQNLIIDILIAHEVLGESLYEIDRKLLTSPIGSAIMPLSLQGDVTSGRAGFEILTQKRNITRKIDKELLDAQHKITDALVRELWQNGYQWNGSCLELGQPARRFENGIYAVNIVIDHETGLPFYAVRNIKGGRQKEVFRGDYGPQKPFQQVNASQWRIDDRTRMETLTEFKNGLEIKLPESNSTRSMKYAVSSSVRDSYAEAIAQGKSKPRRRK
ncbi:MAG: hypothetical protein AABW80_02815 [Nanoarchaeota archaeon]